MYKIVHRQYGSYPYYPDTEQEADELLQLLQELNPLEKNQYYKRKI